MRFEGGDDDSLPIRRWATAIVLALGALITAFGAYTLGVLAWDSLSD